MSRLAGRLPVLVDCAGARMGGALRLRTELDTYLAALPEVGVRVVGRNQQVAPGWLARREFLGRARRVVALNNVGFVATPAQRWVLLRNLLHFLSPDETARIPGVPTNVAREAQVVRACARRADAVVVPTAAMAERVLAVLPALGSRLVVRPHPLSAPPQVPAAQRRPGRFLCPVLFAPFKAMGELLRPVDEAATLVAERTGEDVHIVVTATDDEARAEGLADCQRLRFVGRLTPEQLAGQQRICRALVYPTRLESFGYPLAEARLAGIPVVAAGTAHSREVAGPVLVPYQREAADEIATAMHTALRDTPLREPVNPFAPGRYFDWLLDVRREQVGRQGVVAREGPGVGRELATRKGEL